MKAKLIVLLGVMLVSHYSYACGGDDSCGDTSCYTINRCQCTDPNYDSNPCLTPRQYCDAFGDIGSMDEWP